LALLNQSQLKEITQMSSEKPKGINTGRIVSLVLIGLLSALVIYFGIQSRNLSKKVAEMETTNTDLTTEIEDMEHDLDDARLDLENKDLALEEKERKLAEKEQLVKDKQKRINELERTNKISKDEAARLRGKVEELQFYITKYEKEIEDLKAQIAIKDQRIAGMGDTIKGLDDRVRTTTRDLDGARNTLEAAKVLTASHFTFYRLKGSGKEIQETSFRKGQLDDIKICLDISPNLAASAGDRDIYIQVKDMAGKIVRDNGKSGFFKADGEDMAYSVTKNFNYDRTATPVCLNFAKPAGFEYESGDYRVLAFCEGYEIGAAKFSVK
jgi:predicted RNase H-like nuclease (RuvC/YqgF family)